jgi:hypothetical protein
MPISSEKEEIKIRSIYQYAGRSLSFWRLEVEASVPKGRQDQWKGPCSHQKSPKFLARSLSY